ncbi:C2D1A protein, partial [Anhinga anhinga]|nr:C2D1A protein [Anhinga anhinga]
PPSALPPASLPSPQMGLLVELSPEGDDAAELEAELLALVGGRAAPGEKPQGKTPLPMEAIERMAALCMKDLEEEEDGDDDEALEDEDDLMAELQEVLGEEEGSGDAPAPPAKVRRAPPEPDGIESTLAERAGMYRTAIASAREAGDGSRVRRYERGLKTLENMLASVKKGKKINEEEIPPPVALGKGVSSPPPAPASPQPSAHPGSPQPPPVLPKPQVLPVSSPDTKPAPPSPASHPGKALVHPFALETAVPPPLTGETGNAALLSASPGSDGAEALLRDRQREYKLAALHAKQRGDLETATKYYRLAKSFDSLLEAAGKGRPVELSSVPPPPAKLFSCSPPQADVPPAPRDTLEALQQRMERYKTAAAQAKSKGDDRKARMHERIVKVRELWAPSAAAPPAVLSPPSLPAAQQQLAFLEGRRKQLMQAALRAKQKNDIEGAKLFLRQAKGLDPMIEASQNGLPVDITKVPEAPVNKEDFVLVPRRGVHISPEAASQYLELMKLIRQQHEMCLNYSKQFTHLGNIAETTKFEKMAEDCKQNMEILKQAHARGFPLPKYHYEQRTFSVIKIFPELNSNDMVLSIVKGINLPAPPGVAPNDLDAFVRFEFPYPSAVSRPRRPALPGRAARPSPLPLSPRQEEAQKDKTSVVKNTDSPEFKEQFKLYVNRGHRGLKRVLQTKGIKFEVAHKGGLFKTDRVIGTAQLKLEALETTCEVREIMELLDGRRPTGGKLEVIVRIREPLSSQQLETRTERWLVINPSTVPPVSAAAGTQRRPRLGPARPGGS